MEDYCAEIVAVTVIQATPIENTVRRVAVNILNTGITITSIGIV
jgi:hypothetical protein